MSHLSKNRLEVIEDVARGAIRRPALIQRIKRFVRTGETAQDKIQALGVRLLVLHDEYQNLKKQYVDLCVDATIGGKKEASSLKIGRNVEDEKPEEKQTETEK